MGFGCWVAEREGKVFGYLCVFCGSYQERLFFAKQRACLFLLLRAKAFLALELNKEEVNCLCWGVAVYSHACM